MKVRHGSVRRRALMWSLTIGSTLTLAFWLVSLRWSVGLVNPGGPLGIFAISQGAVAVVWDHNTELDILHWIRTTDFYVSQDPRSVIWFPRYSNRPRPDFSGWWECEIPLWPVALMTGIPGAWLWATRPRRRPGECPACGYDRRGIDARGACPECGQSPAPAR